MAVKSKEKGNGGIGVLWCRTSISVWLEQGKSGRMQWLVEDGEKVGGKVVWCKRRRWEAGEVPLRLRVGLG